MVYLYAMHIEENKNINKILFYLNKISEERREKVKKYVRPLDQKRCILGEVLLRYILKLHYRMDSSDISFQYNKYGKPMLSKHMGIHFNISHSDEWILCGVSDAPIGIDVEGGMKDVLPIAKRFFTEDENKYINSKLLCNQYDAFYKIWTLKESYIKCVGKGLLISLDSFSFKFSKGKVSMYMEGILDSKYIFKSKKIDERYYTALCILDKSCNLWGNDIQKISLEELMSCT